MTASPVPEQPPTAERTSVRPVRDVPTVLDGGRALARAVSSTEHTALVLDFDETLWLRNSTEAYLSSLRPRALATLLLTLLNVARPWRLLPGDRKEFLYRDWIRVVVLTVLMPWGLLAWRRRAPALGREFANRDLLSALSVAPAQRLEVVSFGFRPVVAPLLRGFDADTRLAVSGGLLKGYRIRAQGKRACAQAALGVEAVAGSLVVTDSADDSDLLAACRTPVLVQWPASRFEPAPADSYLPFLYTARGKRPGQRYLWHHVLLEDVLLLCLAIAWSMASPLLGALGLLVLHLSFWVVYEVGYHENDHVAVLRERAPVIPPGTAAYGRRMKRGAAWACALGLAVPGVALIVVADPAVVRWAGGARGWSAAAVLGGSWLLYLLLSRGAYWLYNRIDVRARGYWYLALQITRTAGYALVLHVTFVGAALLAALALARWVPYLSYREVGRHWQSSYRIFLVVVFAVLLGVGGAAEAGTVLTWQAGVALAWLLARAAPKRRELVSPGPAGPEHREQQDVRSVRAVRPHGDASS